MPDWVREHIGEIALLIYILYPILKRWRDRQRKRREQQRPQPEQQTQNARQDDQARDRDGARDRARGREPDRARDRPRGRDRDGDAGAPPTAQDFLEAARQRLFRLKEETSRLLERSEREPRLNRLVPALREDLVGRIETIERSLSGRPTLSTIVQDTTMMQGLEELLRYLSTMARQRTTGRAAFLADADAIADACYAPILELARVQGLDLRTTKPVTVSGNWSLSIVPRFASTRVAPLRIPRGFERDVFQWPAIAHEVASDFYYSLGSIDQSLRTRLKLPTRVPVPESERQLDAGWLRDLFGAWLPEVFADTLATIMLGPAYVESMRRTFRDPGSPQRTAAIMQDGSLIDEDPPPRLRIYAACRVLHHLGHHDEADALWDHWKADHAGVDLYFLPLGGRWVGLSEDSVHGVADSLVDVLLQRPWPELDGFQLLSIPDLAYLHDEHATVRRLEEPLGRGETVREDPRLITSAAVLTASARPALHETILDAALRSIRGVGEALERAPTPEPAEHRRSDIPSELRASLHDPRALREAVILGSLWGQAASRKHSRFR